MESFWEKEACKLDWFEKWNTTLSWNEPYAKWFVGGKLNASYLCLDKHIKGELKDKVAVHWENEVGDSKSITYMELYDEVNRLAFSLKEIGVKKGDIVIVYLPMIPQAIASILAVARLGAIHSVVFSGFSSKALQDRIEDTNAKFVITADFGLRRGKLIPLKKVVDEAVDNTNSVEKVVFLKRYDKQVKVNEERDLLYNDLIKKSENYCEPEKVESNSPLFVLYTSGTTGKPKGIVHSTGGYLVYTYYTFERCFSDVKKSVYWCTGDIGWITGHSYIVYAPLMHGSTIVLYEGAPDYPSPSRWWKMIEKYKVSIFYTSPTAIRMFMKFGESWLKDYDLGSLRVLGSVGEVINPAAWNWYFEHVGEKRCQIIDTWWQTETGGFMIAPNKNSAINELKPGSATFPLEGIEADVVDENGKTLSCGKKGYLVIKKPWPGMAMGIYKDAQRFKEVYWSRFKDVYYSGDYAIKDREGYFWLLGRADEILNIAGHRIGTAELESAVVANQLVAEAAVAPVFDEIRGENFVVFAVLKDTDKKSSELKEGIIQTIRQEIGALTKPAEIYFVNSLPKTRSGKILRRVLKDIVQKNKLGDVTTIQDVSSLEEIKKVAQV